MATTVTFTGQRRRTPDVRVYLRSNNVLGWAGGWELQEGMHCDWCLFVVAPEMPKAQFTWQFGRVIAPGAGAWSQREPLDVLRSFVKVEIDDPRNEGLAEDDPELRPPLRWYGTIEEDSEERKGLRGAASTGTETKRSGVQTLVAYGLDMLLARHVITRSEVIDASMITDTLLRGLEFNARAQLDSTDEKQEAGNRSADKGPENVYAFAQDLTTAEFWSTYDAVDYLLKYHPPTDETGDPYVKWVGDAAAAFGVLPDWDKPRVATHNRTLRDVLNELIDRRRLLTWTLDVVSDPDEVEPDSIILNTHTCTAVDLEFEGNTIPANLSQKAIRFDAASGVTVATTQRATLEAVEQVVCIGSRAVACFTLGSSDTDYDGLRGGWTVDQETKYATAASGVAGYASWELWEQEERNAQARSRLDVARVYSYFGPDSVLQLIYVGSATTNGGLQSFFPDPGFVTNTLHAYFPQARLSSHLPLKTDHDYSGNKIEMATVVDATPPGMKWEYRPMLVAIGLPHTSPVRYQAINNLATNVELPQPSLGTAEGIKWSATVRVQEDAPGIVVTVQGQPQHVLAAGEFSPLPEDEADVATFTFRTMIATVAMQVDYHVEGHFPADPSESLAVRRVVVDLGEEYKQHYVAKGTVVGIAENGSLQTSDGGFIRDDSPKLTALARLLYEWYQTERHQVELAFGFVVSELAVGDLITTIGTGAAETTVNTVITSVKYEFPQADGSSPATARTTIATDFAELDIKKFVGQS